MNERKHIELHVEHSHHEEKTNPKEYGKLALVIAAIFATTFITFLAIDGNGSFEDLDAFQAFLAQFMGVFFIVFASFKLVNLQSFVHGFMMYDVIAKKSKAYATAYPFIQLLLGVGMFLIPSSPWIHFAAAIVSGIALAGVVQSLRAKQEIQCACLGNVIKMPLATVSGIEDGSMFVISLLMFVMML
jgi:hypothetical protein